MLGLSCTLFSWGRAQGWEGTSQAGRWTWDWGHCGFWPTLHLPFPCSCQSLCWVSFPFTHVLGMWDVFSKS